MFLTRGTQMHDGNIDRRLSKASPLLLTSLVLLTTSMTLHASENFRTRQSAVGSFGGDIAVTADKPGTFGTLSVTTIQIKSVKDGNGEDLRSPTTVANLPSPAPAGARLNFSSTTPINFQQTQNQINVLAGYLSENSYYGGRVAVAINVPLISLSRTVSMTPPTGSLVLANGTNAGPNVALTNAVVNNFTTVNNHDVTGVGDTELSTVWIRHQGRMKIAAGVSIYLPTGDYDKNRGPNPGFGDFYTIRPGVAVTYALNPDQSSGGWDAGVTLAGRLSYGMNTKNKETNYTSGDFVYVELAAAKVSGNWSYGTNLLTIQQVTSDTGLVSSNNCLQGVDANGCRFKTNGIGPFVAYKFPNKESGFNLSYNQNFGGVNALVVKAVQARFVKAW